MNELQVFGFEGRNVRVVEKDGNPWWVGRDVCEILGYANSRDAIATFCKGVAISYPLSTDGGVQDVRILPLPDVFRLIIGSRLPDAVRFEAWVFEEVLPSIMKTGHYGVSPLIPNLSLSGAKMRELRLLYQEGAISRVAVESFLFTNESKSTKPAVQVQTPTLPAIPSLDTFLSLPDFAGWRDKLDDNPGCFERMGVKVIRKAGREELAIDHNHKILLRAAGRDYKARLKTDPRYIETRQVHINHSQVSALIFDWRAISRHLNDF